MKSRGCSPASLISQDDVRCGSWSSRSANAAAALAARSSSSTGGRTRARRAMIRRISSASRREALRVASTAAPMSVDETRRALLLARGHGFLEVTGGKAHVEVTQPLVFHVRGHREGVEARPQQPLGELDTRPAEAADRQADLVAVVEELLHRHHA